MAPLKFEENIGEKLGEREITPSSKAWESIASKLDGPKSAKKKRFSWYAIAACIIGLLIVSIVYFNEATTATVEIVDAPKEHLNENLISPKNVETPAIVEEREITGRTAEEIIVKENPEKESVDLPKVPISETVLASSELRPEEVKSKEVSLKGTERIINAKVDEIIAQVNLLEDNDSAITDAEVDSLLRVAQKEILKEKLFNEDRTVDAMALLSEVEGELDKSFREQIFEGLKNRFFEVRTALVDRNN